MHQYEVRPRKDDRGARIVSGCRTSDDPGIILSRISVRLDSEIARIVTALHDKWKVNRVALGHCTGEPAFAAFQRAFGSQYNYAGLGSVIELP
jgi:hypothetical protein